MHGNPASSCWGVCSLSEGCGVVGLWSRDQMEAQVEWVGMRRGNGKGGERAQLTKVLGSRFAALGDGPDGKSLVDLRTQSQEGLGQTG